MRRIAGIVAWTCLFAASAFGQGSQRQAAAVSLQGTPIPGANIWACVAGSTPDVSATPPCSLANIYSDPSLASQFLIAQPLVSDGLGNYMYYAPAGTFVEVITGSNTTGYTSKLVLPCAPNSTASGCSGAAGNPGGSDTQLQINNHSAFGAVTGLAIDSTASPSVLSVPFSEAIKGPRPWVDATAYGADPSGATDSTSALTNAAAAACAAGSTLEIPPGTYALTQPQSPSTSPVIAVPCAHIHIVGIGDQGTAQFEQPPQAKLVVATLGSNPNTAPVFAYKYPANGGDITLENLQVSGYNQALSFYATSIVGLDNVCVTAQSTGLADNVPLKVTNVSWFRMTFGCLNSGSSSLPMALFTGEPPVASEVPVVAFVQMEHVRGAGANFQYIQRVDAPSATPGNFVFNDVTPSGSTTDFFTVTNATGHMGQTAMPQFGPIFFVNSSLPAASGSGALINFNSSGSALTGVHIHNSTGSSQTNPLIAVRMAAGSLQDCEVHGGVGAIVEDNSGNSVGACSLETRGGYDFIADSSIATGSRLRSEITSGANPTPNLRFYASPNSRASYGLDASQGFLFNDGSSSGFNASFTQTGKGSIDVQFANLFAPTNVAGTPATGGAIPPGIYYPFVGTTSNNCATVSAPSIVGAPVTLSGSNNAVAITWTAPLQGVSAINGYCVAIASSSANANAGLSYAGLFASGAGTISATITSASGSMQFSMGNAMSSVHRFTPTGLNLNGGVNFYADTGAANNYAIAVAPSVTSIPLGAVFNFQAAHANTGSSTLNVNGSGAVTIKKNGGTGSSVGANLATGDIAAGQIVTVMYDGTNFQMQSTLGNASAGGGGANAALSNLSSVAINTDLLPNAAGTVNIGSASLPFSTVYANQFKVPGSSTAEIIGNEGSCSTSPIASGADLICVGDSASHTIQTSYNGGSFFPIPQGIASGAANLGTTTISAGNCASAVTVSAPNVTTTDVIQFSLNAVANGYTSATGSGLVIQAVATLGNVNFYVCNPTAASITPGAATLNWRVNR